MVDQEKKLKWDVRFLRMAELVSTFSKDPSTKCGAVLVRPDRTVASVGYNGFPRGCLDDKVLYDDREVKYSRVVHAELNAILSSPERPRGYTLYTWPPGYGPSCDRCSAHIIQSGIRRVVHVFKEPEADNFAARWLAPIRRGLAMYVESDVEVCSVGLGQL